MGLYSRYIFPRVMNLAMSGKPVTRIRKELLLRAEGDVFEIGFGTGLNLPNYPPTVKKITTVDPNPGVNKLAQQRIRESPIEVECHLLSAETLPMDDESFDTVVSTFTLCSIPNVGRALDEIRRVLRPGGKFLFAEHGLADDPKVRRWQDRLNGLQRRIGDGCNLNRNMRELISDHRFKFLEFKNFYMPKTPRIFGYIYQGVAVKE